MTRQPRLLSRIAAVANITVLAALAACGGGGGPEGPVVAVPTVTPIAAPAEPDYAAIGLTATAGKLIDNTNADARKQTLRAFVNELDYALAAAPLADAAESFAKLAPAGNPVDGSYPCPNGGTLTVAGTTYTFAACRITGRGGDSYAIDGPASLVTAGNAYRLSFDHQLRVTPAGGSALNFPPNAPSFADCTASGGCVVTVEPITVLIQRFQFGTNTSYSSSAGAHGTYGCGCDAAGTWYVTVDRLTRTSGTVFIRAGNGTVKIRRNSATDWDAVMTVGGVDYTLTLP